VRVKAHENLMAQAAGQMRPLANSPLAMERISKLGRLLRPQQARGVKKVRLGASNDCGYVCLDDFSGVEARFHSALPPKFPGTPKWPTVGWWFTSMTTPSKDRPTRTPIFAFIHGRSERGPPMTARASSPLWREHA
jgi:hypothetical protein